MAVLGQLTFMLAVLAAGVGPTASAFYVALPSLATLSVFVRLVG